MKTLRFSLIGLLLLTCHTNAIADGYFGLSYAQTRTGSDFTQNYNFGTAVGKIGQNLSENLQAEFRLGTGITKAEGGSDLTIESLTGTYFRVGLETEKFYPHLLLGYSNLELSTRFGSSGGESDISYGVGTDFAIKENWDLNLEYMNYFDKNGVDLITISFGFSLDY